MTLGSPVWGDRRRYTNVWRLYEWVAKHPVDDFVFGFGLFNADGVCCYGTNTFLEEMNPVEGSISSLNRPFSRDVAVASTFVDETGFTARSSWMMRYVR